MTLSRFTSVKATTAIDPQHTHTARKPARLQRRTGFLFSYAHDQEHRQHDPAGKNCIESLPACTTPSRSARRRHTTRPGTPASTGTPSALEAVPTPGGRLGREAPAADDQPHTGNPCPSRPARPAPAFVLEHLRRTRSGAPGIHTQTPRSSSAGLYCQAMPPGIRHKAHCKAHGKAFFQEQGTNKAHSGYFAPLIKQKSPRFTPYFQRSIVGFPLVRSRELESLAL